MHKVFSKIMELSITGTTEAVKQLSFSKLNYKCDNFFWLSFLKIKNIDVDT